MSDIPGSLLPTWQEGVSRKHHLWDPEQIVNVLVEAIATQKE